MRFRTLCLAGFVAAASSFSAFAASYEGAPADVELFFKNAKYTQVTISPNGQMLAALAPAPGSDRRNIALIDLKDRKKSRFLTNIKNMDVASFFWKGDERIVFTMDADGNESFGLYSVALKGGPVKVLVDADKLPWGATAQVMDDLVDVPNEILIQLNDNVRTHFDVYRLNVENGKRTTVERNDLSVIGWGIDHDGDVRIKTVGAGPGAKRGAGLVNETFYRKKGSKDWVSLVKNTFPEAGWDYAGFDWDNQRMIIGTNVGHDKMALYWFDPATGKQGDKIFSHDEVDAGGMMGSRLHKKWLGVTWYTDKPQRKVWDKDWAEVYALLEGEFPGLQVDITSMSKDENRMTVTVWSDREPAAYYLYDRKSMAMEDIAKSRPNIDAAKMSPMKPFKFTARDGLVVSGYITVPRDAKGPVPLIVNPHGGPYGVRDTWGFNREHQFFANRGYATMQVNYRGSGGYGREFWMAGFKKWGREMQNDLTDAVKWAISQNIAAADKVCIYGGSYGGYATMAGMTYTPELYKCGVNYVGVVDIPMLYDTMPKYWEPTKDVMRVQIGDPDDPQDLAMLKAASPLYAVENIKAPIFIVHGRRDPRVVYQHAEYLRDAMKKAGKPYEWLMKENEGHGYRKEENNLELYHKMGDFFAKHLAPPKSVAAP
jgi:dipeptidyl aminopeptidase/acylaminoacyl peptidase